MYNLTSVLPIVANKLILLTVFVDSSLKQMESKTLFEANNFVKKIT